MKRIILIFITLVLFKANCCQAENLTGVPAWVQSGQSIANWFSDEFEYCITIPEGLQSPKETIKRKAGDCDDFAVLASAVLSQLGIKNDIISIKFNGLKIHHAICLWKDTEGAYCFISSKRLRFTEETDLAKAIEKFYPDWEKIILSNEKREYVKVLAVNKQKKLQVQAVIAKKPNSQS